MRSVVFINVNQFRYYITQLDFIYISTAQNAFMQILFITLFVGFIRT